MIVPEIGYDVGVILRVAGVRGLRVHDALSVSASASWDADGFVLGFLLALLVLFWVALATAGAWLSGDASAIGFSDAAGGDLDGVDLDGEDRAGGEVGVALNPAGFIAWMYRIIAICCSWRAANFSSMSRPRSAYTSAMISSSERILNSR